MMLTYLKVGTAIGALYAYIVSHKSRRSPRPVQFTLFNRHILFVTQTLTGLS